MPDETSAAEVLRERAPAPPTPQPSSLYDLSAQLMGQSTAIGKRRAQRLETSASDVEKEARDLANKSREDEAARTAARPTAPALTKPPSTAARAFLEPGASVLGQVQTVMLGIGQIALGMAGAKGRGYAIAATAALKGAAEGWQAGDADRVRRALDEWQTQHTHLMDQYQLERDQFNDLLTNQKLSMSERFAQLRMRAEVMGLKDLADQARQENLAVVLTYLQTLDKSELAHQKVAAEIEKYKAEAEHRHFNEEHSRVQEARSLEASLRGERRTKLAEEFSGGIIKLQQQEIGLRQRLTNAQMVSDAVALLDSEGLLPKGNTFWDKAQVAVAMQTKVGRQDVAQAVQVVQRLGTPLVVGTEIALGMQGQTMRLKVVGEAEAGNLMGAPKAFWDLFIPRAEQNYREQLTMIQNHLRQRSLFQLPPQDDTILETTP